LQNLNYPSLIGCSAHLFTVIIIHQENKVLLYDDACTVHAHAAGSVPLTAAIMLIIKNVHSEQNHSESQCLIKCHNLFLRCPPSADTQQRRRLRQSMASSITRCGITDHAALYLLEGFYVIPNFSDFFQTRLIWSADRSLLEATNTIR